MSKETLEVTAKLSGVPVKTREICDTFLLLTYDIPHNEQGDRMRRKFLSRARMIGATQHTASVYFMPWTPEAEDLALEIATVGEAVVWTSKPTQQSEAAALTRDYDRNLKDLIDKMSERIDNIESHWSAGHEKRSRNMADKSLDKMQGLLDAAERRGDQSLIIYAQIQMRRLRLLL